MRGRRKTWLGLGARLGLGALLGTGGAGIDAAIVGAAGLAAPTAGERLGWFTVCVLAPALAYLIGD